MCRGLSVVTGCNSNMQRASTCRLVADIDHFSISALPDLVMSYKNPGELDLGSTRELTNKCFRIASSADGDLAEDLPQSEGDVVKPINLTGESVAPQPIGH